MARATAKSSLNLLSLIRSLRARIEFAPLWPTYWLISTGNAAISPILEEADLYRFLYQAVSSLRWGTVILLFVLTFLEPKVGRIGLTNWQLILLFAAYNLAAELFLPRLFGKKILVPRVILDL